MEMYKEIDRSGQSKWICPGILLYVTMLGLTWVWLSFVPEGTEIAHSGTLSYLFMFGPILSLILGSLVGYLLKTAIKINPDLLFYTDESREISEFGELYHEEEYETGDLSGYSNYLCFMFLLIPPSLVCGHFIGVFFPVVNDIIPLALLLFLMAILYPVGVKATYHIVSISSLLVTNPLQADVSEDLRMERALIGMKKCELIDSIYVEYRTGTGENLRVVSDVHVFLITTTEPPFTIAITTEDRAMSYLGPEFTYVLESISARNQMETIDVKGNAVFLSVKNIEKGTQISVRYMSMYCSAGLIFESVWKCCNLLNTLLDEIKKHVPFKVVPKTPESSNE